MQKEGIRLNLVKNDRQAIVSTTKKNFARLSSRVDAFENDDKTLLPKLSELENDVDGLKRKLTSDHFARLAEGQCSVECSPYYSSLISGLERVADHLVNVGYSITNPTGSQKDAI